MEHVKKELEVDRYEKLITELKGAIKEALDVFDRPTHQIDTSFPEFTAIRRMKDALKLK